jgi:hypothetical protein
MEDLEFHDKVDKMFESRLTRHVIRIKDLENEKILTEDDMDYDKVLFDSNLNIYKIKNGVTTLVENSNFKALML